MGISFTFLAFLWDWCGIIYISVTFMAFLCTTFFPSHYVCELRIGPPSHGTPAVVYGVINNNIRNIILTLGEINLIRDFWSFAWLGSGHTDSRAGHLESRIDRLVWLVEWVHGVEFYTRAKNDQQQHGLGRVTWSFLEEEQKEDWKMGVGQSEELLTYSCLLPSYYLFYLFYLFCWLCTLTVVHSCLKKIYMRCNCSAPFRLVFCFPSCFAFLGLLAMGLVEEDESTYIHLFFGRAF